MIHLKFDEASEPKYMTSGSAAADLKARVTTTIPPLGRVIVPTGVWIDNVDWDSVPEGCIPELQIRCRSGLAFKYGIMLTNGVGTVDADYPDEIGVLLSNTGEKEFVIEAGDRVAQLVLNTVHRIPNLPVGGKRDGGFGSTQK